MMHAACQLPAWLIFDVGQKMTTRTAISFIRKIAVGSAVVASVAFAAALLFSVQATRLKKEYQDYCERVVLPEAKKLYAPKPKASSSPKVEPFVFSADLNVLDDKFRMEAEMANLAYRRDLAWGSVAIAGILSVQMFAFHRRLKANEPNKAPEPTACSVTPRAVEGKRK